MRRLGFAHRVEFIQIHLACRVTSPNSTRLRISFLACCFRVVGEDLHVVREELPQRFVSFRLVDFRYSAGDFPVSFFVVLSLAVTQETAALGEMIKRAS